MPGRLQYTKMSRKPFNQNESKDDYMEHYKAILFELLSGKDDSFSKRVTKEVQGTKIQNKGNEGHICDRALPLFTGQIVGVSKNDNERLKNAIYEIITFLNNDVDEVNRDIQAMVESGETRQEAVEFSGGLLGKLGKMVQGVDELLNTAASKCRPMTTDEKIELGKCIRKLPEEALDRVVEIITARKPASQNSDKISMNLGELDDATLWRLYYHVEHVLKENKI
uniref:NET domain-containing protein n=1 Tax=Arundo donax TaxID=35708 RepID=A0A0A9HGI7_ARUDO